MFDLRFHDNQKKNKTNFIVYDTWFLLADFNFINFELFTSYLAEWLVFQTPSGKSRQKYKYVDDHSYP